MCFEGAGRSDGDGGSESEEVRVSCGSKERGKRPRSGGGEGWVMDFVIEQNGSWLTPGCTLPGDRPSGPALEDRQSGWSLP